MSRIGGIILSVLFLIAGCAAQPKTLTILHTNDIHANFVPHEATWVRRTPKPMVGGFTELNFKIDSLRNVKPNCLLVDGGDVMTGTPISDIEYKGAVGGALFEMMNDMKYDAWCIGNHDLDVSQDNLRKLVRLAAFPTVCANLVDTTGAFPVGNLPYTIIEKGGLKIGIIGIISQGLYSLVNQNNLVGLRILSPSETVQKYVDSLTPKTDLVIALTHQGVDDDSVLATQVHGLPLIVGAHSHTRLTHPKNVNGVLIVQTGSNCENLGVLDLTVDKHAIVQSDGKLVQLWPGSGRPETPVSKLVNEMSGRIEKEYSEVIGTLSADWVRGSGSKESAIGTFMADAQRQAAHADVGFINSHGIRKDISAGPITRKDLYEVMPFRNILVTFQLSGADLKKVITYYIGEHPALQLAGIDCEWKRGPGGKPEFSSFVVNGKPLDENRMYTCAASDFFVGDAQHYLGMEVKQPYYLQQTVFDATEKAVRDAKTIVPSTTQHIRESH